MCHLTVADRLAMISAELQAEVPWDLRSFCFVILFCLTAFVAGTTASMTASLLPDLRLALRGTEQQQQALQLRVLQRQLSAGLRLSGYDCAGGWLYPTVLAQLHREAPGTWQGLLHVFSALWSSACPSQKGEHQANWLGTVFCYFAAMQNVTMQVGKCWSKIKQSKLWGRWIFGWGAVPHVQSAWPRLASMGCQGFFSAFASVLFVRLLKKLLGGEPTWLLKGGTSSSCWLVLVWAQLLALFFWAFN